MSQTSDAAFLKTFLIILAGLGVIAAVALVAAIWVINESGLKNDNPLFAEAVVNERIAPVGKVRMQGDAEVAASAQAAAGTQAAAPRPGKTIVASACASCHQTGIMDAPKIGDKAAWEDRMDDGLDALVTAAINGKNGMPPKGACMDCSDDEIRSAVVTMLKDSGLNVGNE